MAAVVGSLNLDKFASGIIKSLPAYARPLFLRVMDTMDITGTCLATSCSSSLV